MLIVIEFIYTLGMIPAVLLSAFGPTALLITTQFFRKNMSPRRIKIECLLSTFISVICVVFTLLIFAVANSRI